MRRTILITGVSLVVLGLAVPSQAADQTYIDGHITDHAGDGVPGLTVLIGDGKQAPNSDVTDADGYYRVQAADPGRTYTVLLEDRRKTPSYLTDYVDDSVVVPTAGVTLDHLATPGAIVTGLLRTPSGLRAELRALDVVRVSGSGFPLNLNDDGTSPLVIADSAGAFEIRQLPPGTYKLAGYDSLDQVYAHEWFNTSSSQRSDGQSIDLGEGDSATATYDQFKYVSVPTLAVRAGSRRAALNVTLEGSSRTVPTGKVRFGWHAGGDRHTRVVALTDGHARTVVKHLTPRKQSFAVTYLGSTTYLRSSAKALARVPARAVR